MRIFLLLSLCWGILNAASSAQAHQSGPFEQALLEYTRDKVLDQREYEYLKTLPRYRLSEQDRYLAEHFLGFVDRHKGFIKIQYSFYQGDRPVTLNFAFAPTYSEDSPVAGSSPREVLGNLSQNDTLAETLADGERCGAAALLSAHYLLYGSFQQAFARLNIQASVATYRAVHLAQERLYNYANTDGQAGLTSAFRYTVYEDGRVENPLASGETVQAAKLMGLRLQPLIGQHKDSLYQRRQVVNNLWTLYPEAVLLVGVYLDDKTGTVRSPEGERYPQNHFVLVFREAGRYWMLNSGGVDNGNGTALIPLSLQQMDGFVYRTTGSLDGLTRL
ncbi:MAG: hypothetical protein IGS03_12145 [Candidatus Sericytochromatia bacterium]|nr:hypothetical protein [Candidatus Sericytochromatia bacterium]